jgi:hypothetical protein
LDIDANPLCLCYLHSARRALCDWLADLYPPPPPAPPTPQWKDVPATKSLTEKYHADGSLPSDDFDKGHLELRSLLDEPIAQSIIGEYAKVKFTQESFFAWTEIQEYRHIPTADYRRCTAMHIYEKYIKKDAVCEVGSISEELRDAWSQKVRGGERGE